MKEDSETIFVKDMAYYIMQHEDKEALIPNGYRHAFLFRDPYKAIKSFYKMASNTKVTGRIPHQILYVKDYQTFPPQKIKFFQLL